MNTETEEMIHCPTCQTELWPDQECYRCYWLAQFTHGFYVNVYRYDRAYGGPEEGGWWFDVLDPSDLPSYHFNQEHEHSAHWMRDQLIKEYPDTGNASSVLPGEDYRVFIEPHPPQFQPKERPHYE